jgi:hypothetical protein
VHRITKTAGLVLLHLAAFAVAAVVAAGYSIRTQFARAGHERAYRIGLQLEGVLPDGSASFPPFEEDLLALDVDYGEPTGRMVHMVRLLHNGNLSEAADECRALGWAHCDPTTLVEMRRAVAR